MAGSHGMTPLENATAFLNWLVTNGTRQSHLADYIIMSKHDPFIYDQLPSSCIVLPHPAPAKPRGGQKAVQGGVIYLCIKC